MYIPAHSIRANDNRIVFHTNIMELIDALCFINHDNGIDYSSVDQTFDYRFMYEYSDRGSNEIVRSYSEGLFRDYRWKKLIRQFNNRICNLSARIVNVNGHDHIALNNVIVTLYGEDELTIGYDGALHDFISYFKDTDIEEIGGDIHDAVSCVHSINEFSKYVRGLNE